MDINYNFETMDLPTLRAYFLKGCTIKAHRAYVARKKALSQIDSAEKALKSLNDSKQITQIRKGLRIESRGIIAQSSKGEMTEGGQEVDQREVLKDVAGETPMEISLGSSPSRMPDGMNEAYSLSKFFERPLTIYDNTWALSIDTDVTLDVWDLWSSDPTVRGKLSNYAYFQGDLRVKVAISGTPFHYGKVILSYQPYPYLNEVLTEHDAIVGSGFGRNAYYSYLSQSSQVILVDIKENEPVTLDLPFISPKQAYRLFNDDSGTITNAVSFTDFLQAGQLRMSTLNPPRVANDDYSSAVTVNVYAWCDNVKLSVPTSTNIDITANARKNNRGGGGGNNKYRDGYRDGFSDGESEAEEAPKPRKKRSNQRSKPAPEPESDVESDYGGGFMGRATKAFSRANKRGADEFEDPGPVTKVASAVSKFAHNISEVPVIGPFAKATSAVSGGLSKVFHLFGWSQPNVLDPPGYFKAQPWTNSATTAGHTTSYKLSVDPKQECTIDSSFCGPVTSDDELAIASIASRESYVHTFNWTDTDVALTDTLFAIAVTPSIFIEDKWDEAASFYQPTACAFAAAPFQYWRGTLTYRFEFVCSKFHRGKVLIFFEPNLPQYVGIEASPTKLNRQNGLVIDIQETQNVEFCVKWCSDKGYLMTDFDNQDSYYPNNIVSTVPPASIAGWDPNACMGAVIVQPLNELVQPTSAADVEVNVYVSAPDLQVAAPWAFGVSTNNRNIIAQSLVTTKDKSSHVLVETDAMPGDEDLVYFGESIVSFRTMLKRFQNVLHGEDTSISSAGNYFIQNYCDIYPASLNHPGSSSTNLGRENIYNYLRYAFMGMRGGARYRIISTMRETSTYPDVYPVISRNFSTNPQGYSHSANTEARGLYQTMSPGFNGSQVYYRDTNGGIEFEVPYYSQNRFLFAFNEDFGVGDTTGVDTQYMMRSVPQWQSIEVINSTAGSPWSTTNVDFSTAEDFSFFRFQGAVPFKL